MYTFTWSFLFFLKLKTYIKIKEAFKCFCLTFHSNDCHRLPEHSDKWAQLKGKEKTYATVISTNLNGKGATCKTPRFLFSRSPDFICQKGDENFTPYEFIEP